MSLPIDLIVYCDCGWHGYRDELMWYPFNPVDSWLGVDIRDKESNVIKFTILCPNCKQSEYLKVDA